MKKLYTIFLLMFALALNSVSAQNDPNAKKVLDEVSAKVKSFKGISTGFSIKQLTSKGKDNGTKSGTISIKGQRYVLKQGKMEVVSDGSKIYNFDGSKTITVSAADEPGQSLTPQKIMSGAYDKDFSYKLISSKGGFHEIELRPLDNRKNFQKVNIFVDKSKSLITKAVILDKSNNTLVVTFSNLKTNADLPDSYFVFNRSKYPKDVEILD
ncbi:LolA family protein [Sediminibacterium ginsengisoli]|uniref:Outer membrane lipoprotein-sorting protein n=1 Tax=Sediminibacterium ginsengisoli TaxID=413434 RepID=A0A1T4LGJ9_9BACT|nr:outer membrane lipoprotein carrier protein LolA [Sediminibacterium ginsengisoli]SJZ53892.1 Outer membrane lipoprotein-sorting protein [Sediminibacterium ginsengisoli]